MVVDIAKNLMGVDVELEEGETVPYLHPGRTAEVYCKGQKIGHLGQLRYEVVDSLNYYHTITNRRIIIEYTLIKDVNDSYDDAKELAKLLKGMFRLQMITN